MAEKDKQAAPAGKPEELVSCKVFTKKAMRRAGVAFTEGMTEVKLSKAQLAKFEAFPGGQDPNFVVEILK
ncbi:MAG: hypothetical protein A2V67_04875 [Deltaproteobacteria bacterium RBG_13_61_14]|nr:MAG: hypothetical protein A2V67_04875 [Deltaproteobacteria bacterium RBG_13_61_14]